MLRELIGKEEVKKKPTIVNLVVPYALGLNYKSLISGLIIIGIKDRHVLAVVIATNNLNDFT
jgi:hypothetical protein